VTRLLLLLVVLLGGCAADPYGPDVAGVCPLVRLAEMPVYARGNLLYVAATINGEPVTLLVDTGAERTLLTEDAVKRLNLPRDYQHVTRTWGIGNPTSSWDATLPDGIVLGSTHFPVDRVTVGPFAIKQSGGNADGLLGADILLAFDIDLDLPAHRIIMYRARRGCPDAVPPWQPPYLALAGITVRRDRLMVPFQLDGVPGVAVLDTGAQLSSISEQMAQRLGIGKDALSDDRAVMAHGAAREQVMVRIHRFQELRVGPAVMQTPALPVVPMTGSMGDALVGADFLRGRRVWLSFSTHRVFVTPLPQSAPVIAATSAD
jgi:predicted aspartyl protease